MMRWVLALSVVGLMSWGNSGFAWGAPIDSSFTRASITPSEPADAAATPQDDAPESNVPLPLPDTVAPDAPAAQITTDAPIVAPMQLQPPQNIGSMSNWDMQAGKMYANTSPIWLQAEYLLMWTSGTRLPALLQTDTTSLFGNQMIGDDPRSGLRTTLGVRLGHWCDHFMDAELEANILYLGNPAPNSDFHASSDGDPILGRPFFDVTNGIQGVQPVAFPGVVWGDVDIETSSEFLSAGVVFRRPWRYGSWGRTDWLTGYRYVKFEDRLLVSENLLTVDPAGAFPVGTQLESFDQFQTWNEFNGGELGLRFRTRVHGWTVDLLAKSAIGVMSRIVDVQGATLTDEPSGPVTLYSGGLLSQPTNIGRHKSTELSVIPELGVQLRRRISHSFVFTLGYTLIVVDHVARVGEQIDTAINTSQLADSPLVGPARPSVPMNDRTLWVQGFTMGLEW